MGFFGKLFGKEDRDDSFDLGKEPFANDPGMASQGTGMGSDPYSGQGMTQGDPLATSPSQSGFGDPMGSSFPTDPSLGSPSASPSATQAAYPAAAVPIPGQNRSLPGQEPAYQDEAPSRDVELILAKLDAIKAELDGVHQRVKKLEAASDAQGQQQTQAQQQVNHDVHQKYGW